MTISKTNNNTLILNEELYQNRPLKLLKTTKGLNRLRVFVKAFNSDFLNVKKLTSQEIILKLASRRVLI